MSTTLRARACGKLILSGEHAVVYGAPALVAAVARYSTVSFTPHAHGHLQTFLRGFSREPVSYPLAQLKRFRDRLDRHFDEFLNGTRPVHNILGRPDDLLAYTLASLARRFLPLRGHIETQSELPLGAGMGSSASVIAATLRLYEALCAQPLSPAERFAQIRFCERLQHGKGSAIDAAAVSFGGVQKVVDGQAEALPLDRLDGWYYYLDGIPAASTGECVAQVRCQFGADRLLWDEFAAVGRALEEALRSGGDPRPALRANQALLERLGVVPATTSARIQALAASGATAKVSGAGSVRGPGGGMLLVYQPDPAAWQHWLAQNPEPYAGPLKLAAGGVELLEAAP